MIEIFDCICEMCKCVYLFFDILKFRVNNNKDYQKIIKRLSKD
jgi:hypothetical protein